MPKNTHTDPPGEGALPLSVVFIIEAIHWKLSSHTDWEMTEPTCLYLFSSCLKKENCSLPSSVCM